MQRLSFTIAVLLIGAIVTVGCTSLPEGARASSSVEAFHRQLVGSFNACNADEFSSAYAESFTFTTSHTARAIVESNGLRGYLGYGCTQSPSPQVRVSSERVRVVNDQAIVTGQYVFRRIIGGRLGDETQNYTLVVARTNGRWRVTAHHVSLAP